MFEALGSIFGGGVLGVVGSVITNITGYFKQKQHDSHEFALRKLELELMDKEHAYHLDVKAMDTDLELTKSEDELRAASYMHDTSVLEEMAKKTVMTPASSWLFVLLSLIRGLVRPGLTIYLIVLVQMVWAQAQEVLEKAGFEGMNIADALSIYGRIIDTVLFLATTAIVWWFGSRQKHIKGGKVISQ